MNTEADTPQSVRIVYTNWRGETAERYITPLSIWFGATEWHPEPQWLLKATDLEKQVERDFALKDIHEWLSDQPAGPEQHTK